MQIKYGNSEDLIFYNISYMDFHKYFEVCLRKKYLYQNSKHHSLCSKTLFFALQYFSLFKQAGVSLYLLPCKVSHSKQAAILSFPHLLFPPFQFNPLPRDQLFSLIRFP